MIDVFHLQIAALAVLGIAVRRGNYDTVGGFLCKPTGEIPQIGATFEEGGISYRVVDRDPRHVKMIEIRREAP